jgi:DNA-binding MarR family transcriptional regulator
MEVLHKAREQGFPGNNDFLSVQQGNSNSMKAMDTGYDLHILQSFRRIIHAIDVHSRRLLARFNITTPQLTCLQAIMEDGPLTSAILAQKVHLSRSTIVGIIDRLEKKGLLERKRSTHDRRRVYLTATESAQKLANNAQSPLQDLLAKAIQNLPEMQQATLSLSLQHVVDFLEMQQRSNSEGEGNSAECQPGAEKGT